MQVQQNVPLELKLGQDLSEVQDVLCAIISKMWTQKNKSYHVIIPRKYKMVTLLKIGKGIRCTNLPKSAKLKIEKDLCFDNPEYLSAMKQGRFIPADMSSHIHLYYSENEEYWIPRGYIFYLRKHLRLNNHMVIIKDHTLLLKPLQLAFIGKLRPYQKKAKDDIMSYPVGVLEAATGSGKTVIAISVIVHRQQPTLIIVHSKELLYQWQEAIKKFTGEDCGLIGDGKFKIKPITIGIINTVKKNIPKLEKHFGHIICDECHRIAASTWAETIQDFPARHYLGLTATPFRRDGLGYAIFASLGPKRHKVNKEMLFKTKAVLKPDVYKIESNFRYAFANDYSTMISELTKDNARNYLIVSSIHADLKRFNENVLIVSDRKKHCLEMQRMLFDDFMIDSLVLTGSVNKKERERTIKQVKSGKCKVLFATITLIGEGFDAPDLTTLFLTTPVKFSGRLLQAAGRVLRPKKNKIPRIYDIRDNAIDILKYSGYNRDRIYKKEWGGVNNEEL